MSRHQAGDREVPPTLRVGFIPGVEPDVFARRWRANRERVELELIPLDSRAPEEALSSGAVDMVFARLPWASAPGGEVPVLERDEVHAVPLWEERPVAVMAKDNPLSLFDEIANEDLEGEHRFSLEECGGAKGAVATVAAGHGYAVMPMSLARLHARRDVTHRPLAEREGTRIALVWPKDADDDVRQEFQGVVRGRTARSSRR
ncbi:LysR family transcriptional regulator substrate-binding protein [Dermabacter sp. Marseille-Q3180]|uniref:LysR family transcriptional regulator substrate-binding protein n=1 Tax=Dermabacter sp. Marseille-Q3180 TaxID=2758090 RepID=UPI0032EA167E